MKDIERRLQTLESGHSPQNCLDCEMRSLAGDEPCTGGRWCASPRKSLVDHLRGLDPKQRALVSGITNGECYGKRA
jgi:hypothetical protein